MQVTAALQQGSVVSAEQVLIVIGAIRFVVALDSDRNPAVQQCIGILQWVITPT